MAIKLTKKQELNILNFSKPAFVCKNSFPDMFIVQSHRVTGPDKIYWIRKDLEPEKFYKLFEVYAAIKQEMEKPEEYGKYIYNDRICLHYSKQLRSEHYFTVMNVAGETELRDIKGILKTDPEHFCGDCMHYYLDFVKDRLVESVLDVIKKDNIYYIDFSKPWVDEEPIPTLPPVNIDEVMSDDKDFKLYIKSIEKIIAALKKLCEAIEMLERAQSGMIKLAEMNSAWFEKEADKLPIGISLKGLVEHQKEKALTCKFQISTEIERPNFKDKKQKLDVIFSQITKILVPYKRHIGRGTSKNEEDIEDIKRVLSEIKLKQGDVFDLSTEYRDRKLCLIFDAFSGWWRQEVRIKDYFSRRKEFVSYCLEIMNKRTEYKTLSKRLNKIPVLRNIENEIGLNYKSGISIITKDNLSQ